MRQGDGLERAHGSRLHTPTATSQARALHVFAHQSAAAGDPHFSAHAVSGGFVLGGPRGSLQAELGGDGALLSEGDAWRLRLAGTTYGCSRTEAPIEHDPAPRAGAAPNRVEYAGRTPAGSILEWFINGPLGLEHGFTLESAPCRDGDAEVVVGVRAEGLEPVRRSDDSGFDFRDAAGVIRGSYTDLLARDAHGRVLASAMDLANGVIALRVDAREAAYPVTVDPIWIESARLVAGDGVAGDSFGAAVSLSGNMALVTAPGATVGGNVGQGAAYVFEQSGGKWTQTQKLTASDGAAGDGFGASAAVVSGSASVALIGAPGATVGGNEEQGAAYLYVQTLGLAGKLTWTETKLLASDGVALDHLGSSVGLEWDYVDVALVGADQATVGGNPAQGAAYAFTESSGAWTQQKFLASDGAAGDRFGKALYFSPGIIIAGAPGATVASHPGQGAAYTFHGFFSSSSPPWIQTKLVASDGAAGDGFGTSLSAWGFSLHYKASDVFDILVGAPYARVGGNVDQGAAYYFPAATASSQKLVASDGAPHDEFGTSVSFTFGDAFVGAPHATARGHAASGATYDFLQVGVSTSIAAQAKLVPQDGSPGAWFGVSVSNRFAAILVGAPNASVDGGVEQGAAYVFTSPCEVKGDCPGSGADAGADAAGIDSGVDASIDAGAMPGTDAGHGPPAQGTLGGCNCATARAPRSEPSASGVALFLLAMGCVRRLGRRSASRGRG